MLVSIITPSFNSSAQILETYYSIKNQSYSNWEWVVTDDCSTDNTYEILNEISSLDRRVRVFRNAVNSGAAVSRNNSIAMSNGQFIAFVDSDDLWKSNKLEKQLSIMIELGLPFSFTAYEIVDETGRPTGKQVDTKQANALSYEDMLRKQATLGCSTVMLRKNAFDEIRMPLIRTGQDYGLWLSLLKTGVKAYPINDVLTQYRILPNSISRNKVKKAKRQWQIYRDLEQLFLPKAIECFCFYAYRAVFRR